MVHDVPDPRADELDDEHGRELPQEAAGDEESEAHSSSPRRVAKKAKNIDATPKRIAMARSR